MRAAAKQRRPASSAALLAVLMAGCSGSHPAGAEGRSIDACANAVGQRTGVSVSHASPPWRITSRDAADGYVVNIWTATARGVPRPSGAPDYVCVTKRDNQADKGVRLVQVRP